MFKTKITDMLQIRYPLIQGGLQGLGRAPLVGAVSEAGGLGLITAGSFPTKKEMMEDIELVRKMTDKPIGVNLAIGIRRPMDEFVEGVVEAGVKIVFTSGQNPEPFMDTFKKADIKVVHVAPSIRFAKKAQSIGVDAVVIVGFECGGHPGMDDVTSLALLPRAVDELNIPVIAAGGFTDGRGFAAALALGAEGVQMGTRFVATKECPLHYAVKQHYVDATELDTMIIKRSINKAGRVLKSNTTQKILELESKGAGIEELMPFIGGESYQILIEKGEIESGVIAAGQGIGLINEIKSVKEVVEEIIADAQKALERASGIMNITRQN